MSADWADEKAREIASNNRLICGPCGAPLPSPECGHPELGVIGCCIAAGDSNIEAAIAAALRATRATPPAEAREPATEELVILRDVRAYLMGHPWPAAYGVSPDCVLANLIATRATPAPALVERAPDDRLFNEVESIIAGLSMLLEAVYSGDDYGQLRIRVQDLLKESRAILAALPGAATEKDDTQKQEPT